MFIIDGFLYFYGYRNLTAVENDSKNLKQDLMFGDNIFITKILVAIQMWTMNLVIIYKEQPMLKEGRIYYKMQISSSPTIITSIKSLRTV